MARTVGIGHQNFEQLITNNLFYIDKTMFIKEWWESNDTVTLIARPRRFGKTLNLSMLECFFSLRYTGRTDLFANLAIWNDEAYRRLQGTYPVISLSFATVKGGNYKDSKTRICQLLTDLYRRNCFLLEGDTLSEAEKEEYQMVSQDMPEVVAAMALYKLSEYLFRYYGRPVILLLDEYDTPLQEAFLGGYWQELMGFIRDLLNASFKTNPYLERALMTGITRVGKESIFSDLNNLAVVTTTSHAYSDAFGFTQREVSGALQEYALSEREEDVKAWYDGFSFGTRKDIYNPWSILNYLKYGRFNAYWANTSSNSLVGRLIRESSQDMKRTMEDLLNGRSFHTRLDEQIVYSQLYENETAIWSLLLASGYLKVMRYEAGMTSIGDWAEDYELALTNFEVKLMFQNMIREWFKGSHSEYNAFVKALLAGDVAAMNAYMNQICEEMFSSFDTGKKPSGRAEPERFYHGFVLGLMVDLNEQYSITSNRESGFGRYDVQLEPRGREEDAILLEFKVRNPRNERTLEETLQNALCQLEEKDYAANLRQRGISEGRIRRYGFAFDGKTVLIGAGSQANSKNPS